MSLRRAAVIASPQEREHAIRKALDAATRTLPGARWREDAPLLNKVVNLTEWPSVILGSFDPEFLQLPEEVLVTVMRDHQTYFAIEDADKRLLPHFLAVLNTVLLYTISFESWLAAKLWLFLPLTFLFTFTQLPMLLRHGLSVGEETEVMENPPTE